MTRKVTGQDECSETNNYSSTNATDCGKELKTRNSEIGLFIPGFKQKTYPTQSGRSRQLGFSNLAWLRQVKEDMMRVYQTMSASLW